MPTDRAKTAGVCKQTVCTDHNKTCEKNTDRIQTAGEFIQTVYRLEIQTSTKRGRKIQTVRKAKGGSKLKTPLSLSHGLYFSPTFCRGLYFRSVYGLYEFPSGLYTVCIFLAGFIVVGAYGLFADPSSFCTVCRHWL